MTQRLMGIETEYALTVLRDGERCMDGETAMWHVMECVRGRYAHLPSAGAGIFLGNGARFYMDCGGHPEYAGPETSSPTQAVVSLAAGDAILAEAAAQIVTAIERTLQQAVLPVDLGGSASTVEVTDAVVRNIETKQG